MEGWKARLVSEIERAISSATLELPLNCKVDEEEIDNSVQVIRNIVGECYAPRAGADYDACWSQVRQVLTKVASPADETTLHLRKELKSAHEYMAKVRSRRRKDRETINLWKTKLCSYKRKISSIKRALDTQNNNNNNYHEEVKQEDIGWSLVPENAFTASLDLDQSLPPSSSPRCGEEEPEPEPTPRIKSEDSSDQALELASPISASPSLSSSSHGRRVLGEKDANQSSCGTRQRQHHSQSKRRATSSMETPPGSVSRTVSKRIEGDKEQPSRGDDDDEEEEIDNVSSPSMSPLGVLRKRKWKLNDFVINPATTDNATYAYHATIRGQDRKCLPGHECSHCAKFYKVTGQGAANSNKQVVSRHRDMFERPPSPPGFWRSDFPSTQQVVEERNQAHIQRQNILHSRLAEALRGSKGRWMFKDPSIRQLVNTPSTRSPRLNN